MLDIDEFEIKNPQKTVCSKHCSDTTDVNDVIKDTSLTRQHHDEGLTRQHHDEGLTRQHHEVKKHKDYYKDENKKNNKKKDIIKKVVIKKVL